MEDTTDNYDVYKCKLCGKWHIGHRKGLIK